MPIDPAGEMVTPFRPFQALRLGLAPALRRACLHSAPCFAVLLTPVLLTPRTPSREYENAHCSGKPPQKSAL